MLKQHSLSALFPAMPDDDFAGLVADIRKNGQKEAVIVFEGKVLDGWNRVRACEQAGVKCVTAKHDGTDPIAFVLSRNLHRRHLSGSQRAAVIVAASEWRRDGAESKGGGEATSPPPTVEAMAKAAEVSERTIQQAKVAQSAGLGDAVKAGKVTAEKAAQVAKLPPKKKEIAVAAIERGEDPLPRKAASASELETALKEALKEAREQRDDAIETARELNDQLSALEIREPDQQQKEILKLRKHIAKLEAEIERLERSRNDCQRKNNELIRQVKSLQRKGGK